MKFLEDALNIGKIFCSQTVWLKLGVLTVVTVIVKSGDQMGGCGQDLWMCIFRGNSRAFR